MDTEIETPSPSEPPRVLDPCESQAAAVRWAIHLAGGIAAVARELQLSYEAVRLWHANGSLPARGGRVLAIERMCGGQVTRYQLDPDTYGPPPAN